MHHRMTYAKHCALVEVLAQDLEADFNDRFQANQIFRVTKYIMVIN